MAASSNGTPLWFHGPLGGGEATEALLEAGAADGSFLVRQDPDDLQKGKTRYILSACHGTRVSHTLIDELVLPDGGTRYQFADSRGGAAVGKSATPKGEQTSFPTIPALLAAYRTPSKGAPGPLLLAVNRNIERSLSLSYSPAGRAARPQPAVARSRSVDDAAEAHPQDPPPTTHTWACSVCTYYNMSDSDVCEMCEVARVRPAPTPPSRQQPPPQPQQPQQQPESTPPTPPVRQTSAEVRTNPFNDKTPHQPAASAATPAAARPMSLPPPAAAGAARARPPPQQGERSAPRPQSMMSPASAAAGAAGGRQADEPLRSGSITGFSTNSTGALYQTGLGLGDRDVDEILLCEGPLLKLRGAMQNKKRWFILTSKRLVYFRENAGDMISSVRLSDLITVTDVDAKRFRLTSKKPFGASMNNEMLLEASNPRVKQKWLDAIHRDAADLRGFSSDRAVLIAEGPMLKVQPIGTTSKSRWFRLTNKKFSYTTDEAGEELGWVESFEAEGRVRSVPYEFIMQVTVVSKREFVVSSVQPFTKTGLYEVRCRCSTEAVKNKWLSALRRCLPPSKFKMEGS